MKKCAAVLILFCTFYVKSQPVDGSLNLSSYQEDEEFVINLEGSWKFFEGANHPRLLDTTNFFYMNVPGGWSIGNNIKHFGYGIYQLQLTGVKNKKLALKISTVYLAYSVWINDRLVATLGNPAVNEADFIPENMAKVILLDAESETFYLNILVSNQLHRHGGIMAPILFGTYETIEQQQKLAVFRDTFLIALITVIALYAILMFIFDRSQQNYLFFSLFCLAAVCRLLVTGEVLIKIIWPNIPYLLFSNFKYNGFILSVGFIALFKHTVFGTGFSRKLANIFAIISLLFAIAITFTPVWMNSYISAVFQMITVLGIIMLYFEFIRLIKKADRLMWLLMIGFAAVVIVFIHDVLVANGFFTFEYWQIYGYAIYAVIMAIYFGFRYQAQNEKLDSLHTLLQEYGIINQKKVTFEKQFLGELKSLETNLTSGESREMVKEMINKIDQQPEYSKVQKVTLENLEKLNRDFLHNLNKKFPTLTLIEKELCVCIKAKLTNKEIARIRKISPESVKKSKTRLSKKLNIPKNQNIYWFIDAI